MRYVNLTEFAIELAPYHSLDTRILAPCSPAERLFIKDEYSDDSGFIPICETIICHDLPSQEDTIYIVPMKVKLNKKFKNRDDVVCIGQGSYKNTSNGIEIQTLLR